MPDNFISLDGLSISISRWLIWQQRNIHIKDKIRHFPTVIKHNKKHQAVQAFFPFSYLVSQNLLNIYQVAAFTSKSNPASTSLSACLSTHTALSHNSSHREYFSPANGVLCIVCDFFPLQWCLGLPVLRKMGNPTDPAATWQSLPLLSGKCGLA